MDCLFCKIANGEIPSKKIYEDDLVLAFYDISPHTPIHFLIIPKQHITSAMELNSENSAIVAHVFEVAAKLAKDLKMDNGFRIVNNCGIEGGQTVGHLHFHVLAGRMLAWPPG